MKFFTRELLTLTGALVGGYLVLVHYTGFSRSVASVAGAYTSGVKTLQGR
jgi:hypothetical protein